MKPVPGKMWGKCAWKERRMKTGIDPLIKSSPIAEQSQQSAAAVISRRIDYAK
jgi:hypothetical protein